MIIYETHIIYVIIYNEITLYDNILQLIHIFNGFIQLQIHTEGTLEKTIIH